MPVSERRTQQQRRDTTRSSLLDAGLTCLCDGGLARFTTTEVCTRAGLSQGALFRYFPTKTTLLAATSEHLFATMRAEYERRFSRLPPGRRGLPEALRLLWRSMRDPRLAAAFELYTAARTDGELRGALEPIVRAHVARIRELAASLMPGQAGLDRDAFEALVDLAVLAMQGLVIDEMAVRDRATRKRLLALLEQLAGAVSATME
jgi:AcrR family transcriptional regulator